MNDITTRDILEIRNATWSIYLGHSDPAPGDDGRPYFRVSGLAFCPVSNLLWRAGVPPTKVESERDRAQRQGRYERGNRIEREVLDAYRLAGVLLDSQVPLWDEDLEIKGHADAVWGGPWQREPQARSVYWTPKYREAVLVLQQTLEARAAADRLPITLAEVKSTSEWAIRKMRKEGPAPWYRAQIAGYRLLATLHPEQVQARQIDRWEFVVLDPDGGLPIIFEAERADVDQVEERIGVLVEAWHSGNWPVCSCGSTPGMEWEAKRCNYLNPDDTTECCGNTLLDRLEASVAATAKPAEVGT